MGRALTLLILLAGIGCAPDSTRCVYQWDYPDGGGVWTVYNFWPDAGEACPAKTPASGVQR